MNVRTQYPEGKRVDVLGEAHRRPVPLEAVATRTGHLGCTDPADVPAASPAESEPGVGSHPRGRVHGSHLPYPRVARARRTGALSNGPGAYPGAFTRPHGKPLTEQFRQEPHDQLVPLTEPGGQA